MTARSPRRTNADRSAETRHKLVTGAEEALVEIGHARTTTSEVCRRAGVSNGSLLHHYGTRNNLLAATLQNIYDRFADRVERATDTTNPRPEVLDRFINELFEIFDSDAMKAMTELWLASANDDELHGQVYPVMIGFADGITPVAARCLPGLTDDSEALGRTMHIILITLQGYSLSRIAFGRDQPGEQSVREDLRNRVLLLLEELGIPRGE